MAVESQSRVTNFTTFPLGAQHDLLPLSPCVHFLGPKTSEDETRDSPFSLSYPSATPAMSRKRRHDYGNEEQSSSPLKRSKYYGNVEPTQLVRRRAREKSNDNPLITLRCFICASTSNEGLLPVERQPNNLVPKCRQNGGIWMAHRTCAYLLNGACVFKPSNSKEEVVGGLRCIDPHRFKLVRPPLLPLRSISDRMHRDALHASTQI